MASKVKLTESPVDPMVVDSVRCPVIPLDILKNIVLLTDEVTRISARSVCRALRDIIVIDEKQRREIWPNIASHAYEVARLSQRTHSHQVNAFTFDRTKFCYETQIEDHRLKQKPRCNLDVARNICALAAEKGYLNLIRWARANRAPLNNSAVLTAASAGNIEALEFLQKERVPFEGADVIAAKYGQHKVIEWIYFKSSLTLFRDLHVIAFEYNQLEVLKFLRFYQRCDKEKLMSIIFKGNTDERHAHQLEIKSWLNKKFDTKEYEKTLTFLK